MTGTTGSTAPAGTITTGAATHAEDVAALRALEGRVAWPAGADRYGTFIAESDLGTAPAVREALHHAVETEMFGYISPHLTEACTRATAAFLTRQHGVEIDPDRVRLLPDVLSAMHQLVRRLAPGARIVLPTPAYPSFYGVPPRWGTELVQVPLARDGASYTYDLDALAAELRPGDLFILCNPQNPTGRVHTRAELEAVADVVERSGATVFADEIHASILRPGRRHVPYASIGEVAAGHSVTATSASKSFNLPGLRCAQLVASTPQAARDWDTHGAHLAKEVSTPGVIAVTAAYERGEEWLDGFVAQMDSRHDLLARLVADRLPDAVVTPAEGTFLGWVDLRAYGLGDSPGTALKRHGVLAGDGPAFGRAGAGHVRVNLATTEAILTEIVDRIAAACRAD
ncbi:MAG: MalY/PatB family protein [Actinomycetaceae bacterium]